MSFLESKGIDKQYHTGNVYSRYERAAGTKPVRISAYLSETYERCKKYSTTVTMRRISMNYKIKFKNKH
jgi:hypothetical protein